MVDSFLDNEERKIGFARTYLTVLEWWLSLGSLTRAPSAVETELVLSGRLSGPNGPKPRVVA
jgi:hypothetical protein